MLQFAPAREGMNLSPCLLGEEMGELEGVKVLLISVTWNCERARMGEKERSGNQPLEIHKKDQ